MAKKELEEVQTTTGDEKDSNQRIMLIGPPGSGKTTQINTLPGKKFIYIFDRNVLPSIRVKGVEYLQFVPEISDVDMSVKSLRKDANRNVIGDKPSRTIEPKTYNAFEEDFVARWEDGFFDDVDWLGFDGLSALSEIVMDRILWINGRLGKWPEQDDWTAQMSTISHIMRTAASITGNIFCTAHTEERQDEKTKKVSAALLVTGRLRVRLPQLFSNIFACECESTPDDPDYYTFQTRPDRMHPVVRSSIRGLEFIEDATIKDWDKPEEYGLGRILKQAGLIRGSSSAPTRSAAKSKR